MENYDIDFVVPWVDGNDPEWLAEKAAYDGTVVDSDGEINSVKRYRDWDLMKYWFRGVENYAPWVRKIHFITWGHLPKFLNVNHPKLHIVNHKDFIPRNCLPTYNSCAIEVNLHKISDLTEHFVYFNDDTFLINEVSKDSFFCNGLPKMECVECPSDRDGIFSYHMKNDVHLLNKNYSKRSLQKKMFFKWFKPSLTKEYFCHLLSAPWDKFIDFKDEHLPKPFLKSTWNKVWGKEFEILEKTSSHKFRSAEDVNAFLFYIWQLGEGLFIKRKSYGLMECIDDANVERIARHIKKTKDKFICLNDSSVGCFDLCKEIIEKGFDNKFKMKSSFEI